MGFRQFSEPFDRLIFFCLAGSVKCVCRFRYLREATKQLGDRNYYKEHSVDHRIETSTEMTTFLTHLLHNYRIDKTLLEYLTPNTDVRTPMFYLLPKIHKGGIPGRYVMSDCSYQMEKLLSYLYQNLRPIVEESASYIKGTTHLLQQIFEIHTSIAPSVFHSSAIALFNIPHATSQLGNSLKK